MNPSKKTNERTATATATAMDPKRAAIIALLIAGAFLLAFGYAQSQKNIVSASSGLSAADGSITPAVNGGTGSDTSAGCACCGGGSSEPIEGSTTLSGDVQTISVDVSTGYDPNVIRAKAGVPIEITFGQGGGCTAEILFKDFGILEDLTAGPKTIKLPALEPGEYGFSCGMEMIFGTLIVE